MAPRKFSGLLLILLTVGCRHGESVVRNEKVKRPLLYFESGAFDEKNPGLDERRSLRRQES